MSIVRLTITDAMKKAHERCTVERCRVTTISANAPCPVKSALESKWTALDGDRYVFGNAQGCTGFVCNTPFGWIYAWKGGTAGPFVDREAAMADVQRHVTLES